ncbi:MAG: thioredoxin domain-containing protein [Alteraurantiacibacter sp.]
MTRRALALLAALAAPAAAVPAMAQDWNVEIVQTAQGHRVGNPDAELQIIEFNSYTCPHCAQFERDSEAELKYLYVHEGMASLEVRHLIRNIVDVTAALAAECGDDEDFFGNHRAILNTQDDWLAKARAISPAQQARWNAGGIPQRIRAVASDLDFYELMEPRGYSRSQLDQCLSDQSRAEELAEASNANAAEFGVQGTPSFVLNGTLLDGVHAWLQLRTVLAEAREASE